MRADVLFLCYGEWIPDYYGDYIYVSALDVARAYGLPLHHRSVKIMQGSDDERYLKGNTTKYIVKLFPRIDDDYDLFARYSECVKESK